MRVGLVGAGAIGRFVAAELAEGGAEVVALERRAGSPRVTAVRVGGRSVLPTVPVRLTTDPAALSGVEAILVAVKGSDTEAVGRTRAPVVTPGTVVVSLQNGLDNADRLRAALGSCVAGGVVTYNVYLDADGCAHQATSGPLMAEALGQPYAPVLSRLAQAFARGGERLELRRDIAAIQAGKLLVNLNNGVCAATGLGIAASLRDGDTRACFAMCIEEGSRVFAAAGRRAARVTALPPWLLARALRLPDAWVSRLAKRLANVDEEARSSTLQDLDRGRATEIGELNGAIVALAERVGATAPANAEVTAVVREHERAVSAGDRPTFVTPAALRARLLRAVRGP